MALIRPNMLKTYNYGLRIPFVWAPVLSCMPMASLARRSNSCFAGNRTRFWPTSVISGSWSCSRMLPYPTRAICRTYYNIPSVEHSDALFLFFSFLFFFLFSDCPLLMMWLPFPSLPFAPSTACFPCYGIPSGDVAPIRLAIAIDYGTRNRSAQTWQGIVSRTTLGSFPGPSKKSTSYR
jgi:hypothetical protein